LVLKLRFPRNLVGSFALALLTAVVVIHLPTAGASCSSGRLDNDEEYQPSSSAYGVSAYDTVPFQPALCGGGISQGGYWSENVGQQSSSTCYNGAVHTGTYLEADIFYGNDTQGDNSGSHLAYRYETQTANGSGDCVMTAYDASSGGTYPYADDNVSVSVTPGSGTTLDISWRDITDSVTLSVTGIGVTSQTAFLVEGELEVFNSGNIGVAYWGTLDYRTSSGTNVNFGTKSEYTGISTYTWVNPNTFADDYCTYYTGYLSYCP